MAAEYTHAQTLELRKLMEVHFDGNGLNALCNTLGVDPDNIPGNTKTIRIIELLGYCRRHGISDRLPGALSAEHPEVAWPLPGGGYTQREAKTHDAETPAAVSKPTVTTIVMMAANPSDTVPLRLGQEQNMIDEGIERARYRERFALQTYAATRVNDIQRVLLKYNPGILHFSGHAKTLQDRDNPAEVQVGLLFEGPDGRTQPVKLDALASTLSEFTDTLRLVVLNACWSDKQAQVIADTVGCVVGMSSEIADDAARQFALGFYQGLAFGRSVASAFRLGCGQIDLQKLPEAHKPHLRLRAGANAEWGFV
jgi:hypothetical protein